MPPRLSLAAWLERLERLHPSTIELGLDRVRSVKQGLALVPAFPLIIVGGTNGKGSTCAYLEAVLRAAGYKTGCYTSPHLLRYNERVRIGGGEAADADLVRAFERVDAARGDTSLTYFEFGTLGAMLQFVDAGVDVAILEVGLGGRLDAVNVFDADVAVVTSVDIDHVDYLGDTREKIGFEKAGIFRAGRPAICADPVPPEALLTYARSIGADLRVIERDFAAARDGGWTYRGREQRWHGLPLPAMAGAYQLRNAAAALAALEALAERLPVSQTAIRDGLASARLRGRFQRVARSPDIFVDVAHNPEAARALAGTLREQPAPGRTLAVVGMLADKDASGVFAALAGEVDAWWVCTPDSPRARSAGELAELLRSVVADAALTVEPDVVQALDAARSAAREGDRIVVFGSFYTAAAVLDHAVARSENDLRRRARRRLIGAVALTLLAVIVLPLLLEDEPPPASSLAVKMPPPVHTTSTAPEIREAAAVAVQQTPQRAARPEAAPKSEASEPGPASEKRESAKRDTPKPVAEKPASRTAEERARPPVQAKPAALHDAYVVQLAALADPTKADSLKGRAVLAGFPAYTDKVGTLTRVRVGPYTSRDAASAASTKLARHGLAGQIVAR